MPLSRSLVDAQSCSEQLGHSFESLAHQIPTEWVREAVRLSSHATIRRRRLPGDMVLWLVLGMALFRTQDTPQLRAHFGSGNTGNERQTPFPTLRLVALMNVRSHVLADAAISPYRRGEIPLAEPLLDQWPERSITLLDKGFFSANLLLSTCGGGQQRHWVIPERKRLVYQAVEEYGPGDRLVQMAVSAQARKANPALPLTWQARAVTYDVKGGRKTVFTSLAASDYSAEQVAQLYH